MDESTKTRLNNVIIVMGVSGSGKSTIARLLAGQLSLPFYDADDFHPVSNIEKMKNGIPLNDMDRQPWLETLANEIEKWKASGGAVLACSALKEAYRNLLESQSKCTWVYLKIPEADLSVRFEKRADHFMPADLIQSQFATLEEPEYGIHVDARQSTDQIIKEIISQHH